MRLAAASPRCPEDFRFWFIKCSEPRAFFTCCLYLLCQMLFGDWEWGFFFFFLVYWTLAGFLLSWEVSLGLLQAPGHPLREEVAVH